MRSQINSGELFGIKIGLHYSWFLIAFLIACSLVADYRADNPQWSNNLVVALAIATSMLSFHVSATARTCPFPGGKGTRVSRA